MSETHVFESGRFKLVIRIKEHEGYIDINYQWSRQPGPKDMTQITKFNTAALSEWESSPKPHRYTDNFSKTVKYIYPHPVDMEDGMKRFKKKRSTHE